jgi:hypothetical protein
MTTREFGSAVPVNSSPSKRSVEQTGGGISGLWRNHRQTVRKNTQGNATYKRGAWLWRPWKHALFPPGSFLGVLRSSCSLYGAWVVLAGDSFIRWCSTYTCFHPFHAPSSFVDSQQLSQKPSFFSTSNLNTFPFSNEPARLSTLHLYSHHSFLPNSCCTMPTKLAQTVTLREFLTQEKPSLVTSGRMRPTNSQAGVWPVLHDEYGVKPWSEFNLDVLNQSFGHILDTAVPPDGSLRARAPQEVYPENAVIKKIEDIQHLILWNNELLEPALNFARNLEPLGHLPKLPIHLQCRQPGMKDSAVKVVSGNQRPQVGHLISLQGASPDHLLVGIVKPAVKFSCWGHSTKGSFRRRTDTR